MRISKHETHIGCDKNGFPAGLLLFFVLSVIGLQGTGAAELAIRDYRQHLNPRFEKKSRTSTQFIIIHTSEAGLRSTLRTLSKGKKTSGYRTVGGHSHYTVARNGDIYRIMDHRYRADHTGLSMWEGIEDISSHSIGIELVGFHYDKITDEQYISTAILLEVLQRIYDIPDRSVLTHCQVSYGKPNFWFKKPHRGRKRCAMNFDRIRAGLTDIWPFDPDVQAGRLVADRQISQLFYGRAAQQFLATLKQHHEPGQTKPVSSAAGNGQSDTISNIIGMRNTAWNIAGEDYNSAATVYILPDRKIIRGDRLETQLGWQRLPPGTQVLLNQPLEREKEKGPIFQISETYTAWSFAGTAYRKKSTIYFFPNGMIIPGDRIDDWDSLPDNTSLIIGYRGPFEIRNVQGKTPWGIAGSAYDHPETVYLIPGTGLRTGSQVEDFSDLPLGSKIFLRN